MLGTLVLAPLSLIAIFRFGTREAEQWLAEEEQAHEALVDTLHAGSFPDDPGWRRVAALVERSAPQAQGMIREYVTILSELVLTEELALLHKTTDAAGAEAGLGAKFDRLAELKQRLGKTTLSARDVAAALQPGRLLGAVGTSPPREERQARRRGHADQGGLAGAGGRRHVTSDHGRFEFHYSPPSARPPQWPHRHRPGIP